MFVDASAIVAIITREPDAKALADVLDTAINRITSPLAVYEATLAVMRKRRSTLREAEAYVLDFLTLSRIELIPITIREAATALDAFSRYGKGRGHPAQLNLCDCFAYAAARNHRTSLLFKGDDFVHTDILAAIGVAR